MRFILSLSAFLGLFAISNHVQAQVYSAGKVYNITSIRAQFGRNVSSAYVCRSDVPATPSVFAPPRDNPATSADENKTYLQAMRDFDYRLSTISSDYLRSSLYGDQIARCALLWLDKWASKNFMVTAPALTTSDPNWWQLQYERAFLGASIAQHYAAIAGQPGLDATRKARVANWLKAMAKLTYNFSIYREKNDPTYRYNNIYAWMGLHMMTVGLATGDATLKNRGVYSFQKVATHIRTDGLVTTELLRVSEGKSFWYHNYWLRPMFMMAEIMLNNGVNLYAYKAASTGKGTIVTVAKKIVAAYANFATFPDYAKQKSMSVPAYFLDDNTGQLDWMELFRKRYYSTDTRVAAMLVRARSKFSSDIVGGILKSRCGPNGTVAWGVRTP